MSNPTKTPRLQDLRREAKARGIKDHTHLTHEQLVAVLAEPKPEPTVHRVELIEAPASRQQYGITHLSRHVFQTSRGSHPTRVQVWCNTGRPNPRNGEPVRFGEYGPIDGGRGAYLDPGRKATDAAYSILLSPESVAITSNGTNTGTEASGQVYAPSDTRIVENDTLVLALPDGRQQTFTAHFTNNGHGVLIRYDREPMLSDPFEPEPAPVWTPRTPDERRRTEVAALVAETMNKPEGQRYAAAYGTLSALVISDIPGVGTEWAREYVRGLKASM